MKKKILLIPFLVGAIAVIANLTEIISFFKSNSKENSELDVRSLGHFSIAPSFFDHGAENEVKKIEYNGVFKLTNATDEGIVINNFKFRVENKSELKCISNDYPSFEISKDLKDLADFNVNNKEVVSRLKKPTYPYFLEPNSYIFIRIHFLIGFKDSLGRNVVFEGNIDELNQKVSYLFGQDENIVENMKNKHDLIISTNYESLTFNLESRIPFIGKEAHLQHVLELPSAERDLIFEAIGEQWEEENFELKN